MAGQPLSNEDFRKLMATPRPGGQTPAAGGGGGAQQNKFKKSSKPYRPKPKANDDEKEEDQGPAYR